MRGFDEIFSFKTQDDLKNARKYPDEIATPAPVDGRGRAGIGRGTTNEDEQPGLDNCTDKAGGFMMYPLYLLVNLSNSFGNAC